MYNMQSLILQFFFSLKKDLRYMYLRTKLIRCTVISTESIFILLLFLSPHLPLSLSHIHTEHSLSLYISLSFSFSLSFIHILQLLNFHRNKFIGSVNCCCVRFYNFPLDHTIYSWKPTLRAFPQNDSAASRIASWYTFWYVQYGH